jgi:hypothetical protein
VGARGRCRGGHRGPGGLEDAGGGARDAARDDRVGARRHLRGVAPGGGVRHQRDEAQRHDRHAQHADPGAGARGSRQAAVPRPAATAREYHQPSAADAMRPVIGWPRCDGRSWCGRHGGCRRAVDRPSSVASCSLPLWTVAPAQLWCRLFRARGALQPYKEGDVRFVTRGVGSVVRRDHLCVPGVDWHDRRPCRRTIGATVLPGRGVRAGPVSGPGASSWASVSWPVPGE